MNINKMKKGRLGEYRVILRLIESGFDVYPSLVDDRGVDCVVHNPKGWYLELQIKSAWSEGNAEWFQVQTQTESPPIRPNFFIICLAKNGDCWVFPSNVFFDIKYSNKSRIKKGGYTFDLDLSARKRGTVAPRGELLKKYKENWDILKGYSGESPSNAP